MPDPFRGIDSALQSPISASSDTVCTPQASNTSSPPDPTPRKSAIHKAFLARQKRWETEQASELSKCEKFLVETCGCTLADGAPCSTLFKQQYIMDTRAQCFFLSRDQLDMLILGSVVCTICEDDDVGVRSSHKPTKRQRTTIEYVHKAYSVCRKTFTFLHGISKHKLHAIKDHFLDNGISPREHGNTGKQPKHSLSFNRILGILQFIQNYAEQHAVLLPGRIPGFKRDDVKVLPSSDTKKVFLY